MSLMTAGTREEQLVQSLRQMFLIARDERRQRHETWTRNYRLVHNRWNNTTASSNWMPAPKDSEIYPALSSLVAWMTDHEIYREFTPAVDPNTEYYKFCQTLADDLSDVLYTTWLAEDYQTHLKLSVWDALIYGIGIHKNCWDNQADGGAGNAVLKRVDPWSFYPDPYATSFADMNYCVEVRRVTYEELERRFPNTAWRVQEAGLGIGDEYDKKPSQFNDNATRNPMANVGLNMPSAGQWPGSNPAVQGQYGRPKNKQLFDPLPGYVLYEFWIRENDDYYDVEDSDNGPVYTERHIAEKWRVVCMCANQILMDEYAEDLWRHAQHPYERFVFDDVGEFYGISLVDHLAQPQIYINRLLTAMQQNAELVGNPIFIESAASGLSRVNVVNRPGQRLTVQGGAAAMNNKPSWLEPPQMPQFVMELVQFWISRIENTSGLRAMQKGEAPNQRNAEGVFNSVQEAAFVRIRSALANLESALRQDTIKLSDLICENFTEDRLMAIVGQDGKKTAMYIRGHHFYNPTDNGETPMKFMLQVQAGASTPTSRAARIAEADKLLALGVVDDQYVLEAHRVRNIPEVLERVYSKKEKGLMGRPNVRQAAGRSQ